MVVAPRGSSGMPKWRGGLGIARPAVSPVQRLEDSAALSRRCRLSQ